MKLLRVLDPAILHIVKSPVTTILGKPNLGSERVRKRPQDRKAQDWNALLQARDKRARRAERRKREMAVTQTGGTA